MGQYAVLGLGSFGKNVAIELARLGHTVVALDEDEDVINEIKDDVHEAVIVDITDQEAISPLGLGDVDAAVVGVGVRLEDSILATLILKEEGVPRILAKAMSDEHEKILRTLGADVIIRPEREMARKAVRDMVNPDAKQVGYIAPGYSIVEMPAPASWSGKSMAELKVRQRFDVNIICVKGPHGDGGKDVVQNELAKWVFGDADVIFVLGHEDSIAKLQKKS